MKHQLKYSRPRMDPRCCCETCRLHLSKYLFYGWLLVFQTVALAVILSDCTSTVRYDPSTGSGWCVAGAQTYTGLIALLLISIGAYSYPFWHGCMCCCTERMDATQVLPLDVTPPDREGEGAVVSTSSDDNQWHRDCTNVRIGWMVWISFSLSTAVVLPIVFFATDSTDSTDEWHRVKSLQWLGFGSAIATSLTLLAWFKCLCFGCQSSLPRPVAEPFSPSPLPSAPPLNDNSPERPPSRREGEEQTRIGSPPSPLPPMEVILRPRNAPEWLQKVCFDEGYDFDKHDSACWRMLRLLRICCFFAAFSLCAVAVATVSGANVAPASNSSDWTYRVEGHCIHEESARMLASLFTANATNTTHLGCLPQPEFSNGCSAPPNIPEFSASYVSWLTLVATLLWFLFVLESIADVEYLCRCQSRACCKRNCPGGFYSNMRLGLLYSCRTKSSPACVSLVAFVVIGICCIIFNQHVRSVPPQTWCNPILDNGKLLDPGTVCISNLTFANFSELSAAAWVASDCLGVSLSTPHLSEPVTKLTVAGGPTLSVLYQPSNHTQFLMEQMLEIPTRYLALALVLSLVPFVLVDPRNFCAVAK